jgi:hypothetical protein
MLRKVSARGAEDGPLAWSCQDVCLRVLPHSSTPAILSKTLLRMGLWTSSPAPNSPFGVETPKRLSI